MNKLQLLLFVYKRKKKKNNITIKRVTEECTYSNNIDDTIGKEKDNTCGCMSNQLT